MRKNNICGVVTLYNPTEKNISNIASYINGLDCLFVVDNSPIYDSARFAFAEGSDKVKLLSFGKNIGIGAALNLAVIQANKLGYEWLLTMDQDSFFNKFQFEKYIMSCLMMSEDNVALFSPVHDQKDYVDSDVIRYDSVEAVSTSGNLLNLAIIEKIGFFNEQLFIDSVDHDYCLRARILGYRIIRTKNICLYHKIGEDYIGSMFKIRKKTFYIHSPKRMYFIMRNALYLRREYGQYYPEYTKAYVKRIFERASKCVRYTDRRSEYLKYIVKGILDYARGHYGNRVNL